MQRVFPTLVAACAFAFGLVLPGVLADAVEYSPAFRWSGTYAEVRDLSNWPTEVSSSTSDYNNNTDLTMVLGTGSPTIWISQYDMGSGPSPYATAWSGSTYCLASYGFTGYCNTTTVQATGGAVYLNTNSAWSSTMTFWGNQIIRHEMGHILGFNHETCGGTSSVMAQGGCPNGSNSLTSQDISNVNGKY